MSSEAIAIVGLACKYPDASDLQSLWDLVLTGRRAFRRIPPGRLDLGDYRDGGWGAPDTAYFTRAALIEGWELDHAACEPPGATNGLADPGHMLALETAAQALSDAGFPGGQGLGRERAGVIVGNTLTSQVRRAATLRLHWPYVRRALAAALASVPAGAPGEWHNEVLEAAAKCFAASLPEVTADTLANGLASSIAGRICAHFGFKGGGHAVEGACSSSLIAVASACTALTTGDLDFALAGGVDIGLDAFDLIGFARAGALATYEMRIYDATPTGFLLGEGCGIVALMRARDAHASGVPVYADITGWGISSAGNRRSSSEPDGLLLALRRAYERAEADPARVQLFEGHAAGTAASDLAELTALAALRADAPQPAALGSIKANIGHTRAAAGIAGLLKTVLAMSAGTLPPTTGCEQPHPLLRAASAVRVLAVPEPWPEGQRLAGVSTMGFGGTNAHVVLCRTDGRGGQRDQAEPAKAAGPAGSGDDSAAARTLVSGSAAKAVSAVAINPKATKNPEATTTGAAASLEAAHSGHAARPVNIWREPVFITDPRAAGRAGDRCRFLETVRVHRPGVELVADAAIGPDTDPYLADYRPDGRTVLPAVIGLEAMAQAAAVLSGLPLRQARNVELVSPVAVPRDGAARIRVCALRRDDAVEAVLCSIANGQSADHMRAMFPVIAGPGSDMGVTRGPFDPMTTAIVDGSELYGPLCAHTGRFRRVAFLPALTPRSCCALLRGADDAPWFGRSLAHGPLLLGSPGVNDAAIHVLQACVPHRRLVAAGCESMTASGLTVSGAVEIRARERSATADEYVWDVEAVDGDGRMVVEWAGLRLLDSGPLRRTQPWPPALLAVYLERGATALGLGSGVRVTVRAGHPRQVWGACGSNGPATGTGHHIARGDDHAAGNGNGSGSRSGDGSGDGGYRPGALRYAGTEPASRACHSYLDGLTLTVETAGPAACDWAAAETRHDPALARTPACEALRDQLRERCGEPAATVTARVWTAVECMSKAGLPSGSPLVLDQVHGDGWVLLRAGGAAVASTVVAVSGVTVPVAVAIMTAGTERRIRVSGGS